MSDTKQPEWEAHTYAESVICPYCGANNGTDDYQGSGEEFCYECNQTFDFECDYSVTYTTRRKEPTP